MSVSKDVKPLIRQALSEGWRVERTNGGHIKWIHPSGGFLFSSSTPSDRRAIRNLERDLRRLGLKIEH